MDIFVTNAHPGLHSDSKYNSFHFVTVIFITHFIKKSSKMKILIHMLSIFGSKQNHNELFGFL
jgi:hypothetical protein